MRVRHALFFAAMLLVNVVRAQEQAAIFSGPQVDEKLPALKVSVAYGQNAGQTVDYIELAANRPALLVIVNGSNRPAANLTRCLMNFAEMHADKLFAGVVYLDSDRAAAEQYLRQATSWWGVGPPVGISIDGAEGPGSYGLNRNVNLTVLVANQGRVASNFALVQPSSVDAPKILREVVMLIGGRVPTIAEIEFLSMPTHKPPNAPWAAAPSNVKMRELICTALAAQDSTQADAAASAIEQFIQDDKERQGGLGSTSEFLLSGRGQAAVRELAIVEHLRKWQKAYAPPPRTRAK
jgi:hypothetical protein